MTEVRVIDPNTGGAKGQKDVQLSMLPVAFLEDLGRVYAMGAEKYSRDNWRKGYAWHLSFDAMLRHLLAYMRGEDTDPESGLSHLAHVAWHTATLHTFAKEGLGTDDRNIPNRDELALPDEEPGYPWAILGEWKYDLAQLERHLAASGGNSLDHCDACRQVERAQALGLL